MIKDITESGFESGVTLNSATITLADMGERTITADVKIAGGASIGDNSRLAFRGETFVPAVKDPQALKNNERVAHVVSVTFQSYVISELKRYWFFNSAIVGTDVVVDAYTYQIGLPLQDFVTLFNRVLSYYYGSEIVMDASTIDMSEHPDAVYVEIDYTTIWDVLLQIYEKYGVRWKIVYVNNVYTITLSNTATTLSHVFSYGYDGGLTSIERQVNDEIHNKIFGRGVDTNVPPYYFHRIPTGDTSGYQSDPDALYELKDIYFDTLRDATFRWYVRGWMQNPNHDTTWEDDQQHPYVYPTYDPATDIPSTPTTLHDDCLAAYNAGLTDSVFNPIEYVKDDASILRYGEIWGNAEPNEDIYPSVKTAIVGYYNDQSDEVKDVTEKESRIDTLDDAIRNALVWAAQYGTIQDLSVSSQQQGTKYVYTGVINPALNEASNGFCSKPFNVETGLSCYPTFTLAADFGYLDQENGYNWVDQTTQAEADGYTLSVDSDNSYYYAKNPDTGEYLLDSQTNLPKKSPLSIPEGTWQLEFHIKATQVTKPLDSSSRLHPFWRFRIRVYNIKLTIGPAGTSPYRIFNVWLPNLWNTTKGQTETADDYVTRVWNPILGTMQEAAVYFVSGDLARSADYDFKIVAPLLRGVEYDTSKTYNGVQSEWKLTLEKSEAEYQADGKFIPRTGIAPAAGDKLAFKGGTIVYPQSIVETAENDINGYKHKVLDESKDIQPSWNIQLDKVRINTLATGETSTIYSQLDAGKKITISSNTLIPDGDHTRSMFIESMTITWSDGTVGKPDVEIVLAKEVRVYHSAIETLQANIREVEVNSINEGEAEQVASRTAARDSIPSTGSAARAAAPLELANVLQSPDFKTGLVEGEGWAIYRDTFGNCVIEADKLNVRKGISAPTLEIDEWKHQGGVQILSAANMRIDSITDTGTTLRCFFDTKSGSITNLFHEHDIVLCTRTDETTGDTKAYRYEVVAIGETFVELSKTNHTGDTAAVGDEIIQFGNTQDVNRQHVIILDAASGHERMLFGLNSITAAGDVYYYAGAIQVDGTERRRWFVGDTSNSSENFIEYAWNATSQSYVLTIGGDVYVGGGGVSIDTLNYLAASLHDNGSNGLILSNQIAVYSGTGQQAQIQGGINGDATASQIAAWFGGAMTTEGQTAAKVVFKFDGSGYVAANHISWDASGNCTIDGTVQLASGGTVGDLLTLVQGALQKSAVTSKGSTTRPIYFDSSAVAQEITGLNVPGDVQTTAGNVQALAGGVAANGIADLSESGGGGAGTVTDVKVNNVSQPQSDGTVSITVADVALSGNYNDLNNKPTIPAAQIQSDWNQTNTSALDFIKNKPTIANSIKFDPNVSYQESSPFTPINGLISLPAYKQYLSQLLDDATHRLVTDSQITAWTAKYDKPSGGIPSTDLTSTVQTSLGKADTAYQLPSGGMPSTDMSSAVQTSLGKADTAYQLPSGGIPKTDLANAVQASLIKADYAIPALEKGAANGVAELDAQGLVPASQLPSYVDDIVELLDITDTAPLTCVTGDKYFNATTNKIYTATGTDTWGTAGKNPEGGKIYVNLTDSNTYRWSGSTMVEISKSLALGETSTTAYRGDRGKIAYDHSQITSSNPHGVQIVVDGNTIKTTNGTAITVPFATKAEKDASGNTISTYYQVKVTALGSTTEPVYISAAGTFSKASKYAGGTLVNLNGTNRPSETATFYAPVLSGTVFQILMSGGANASPSWINQSDITAGDSDKLDGKHLNELFTLLENDNNQISITVGTVNKKLTVAYASVAGKLGTSNVGSASLPIYLSAGTPTAISSLSVTGAIQSTGSGVSANGIADLAMVSGGGSGTLTAIKIGSVEVTNVTDGVVTIAANGTFNATSNPLATVQSITDKINLLDGSITGSAGASKTLTAFSQTNGIVTATFSDIAIAWSQITSGVPSSFTPSSHTHGNISNSGTLTDTAAAAAGNDYVVIRDADNAKIQTSTIKGTDVADAVSKKHSHSSLTLSTTAQAYDGTHTLALPATDPYTSARTPSSHTHGNIQNGGTLQTNDITIANGDKLVVTDSSDSAKVARASVSFDGSTTNKALTPKGTWETFLQGNQTITLSGDVSGSGTTSISVSIGTGKVTNAMLAGSIANGKLANSAITINGSSTSLGSSFNTASINGGTAGTSSATSGLSISIPYVTISNYGIVTAFGTHTHSISASDITTAIGSTTYAPYNANGYAVQGADNNLIDHNDEFNFLPSGFSATTVWINYRTKSAAATNNYVYRFANGKANAGYAAVEALKFIVNGGTSSQFLKADGSLDSNSYYLASNPNGYTSNTGTVTSVVAGTGLSGGTITTSGTISLNVAASNALGGIKIGYASQLGSKNYPVSLDSDNRAYVYVPWENTTYTLADLVGSSAIGGTTTPIYYNGSALVAGTALGTMAYASTGDYLPLSGGTMSNTNLVTNLNADLLDGKHNGELTALNMTQQVKPDQEFTYRVCPKTIDADSLVINKFKGRTVVWNQRANLNALTGGNTTRTINATGFTSTAVAGSADKSCYMRGAFVSNGHSYYLSFDYKSNLAYYVQDMKDAPFMAAASNWTHSSKIGVCNNSSFTPLYWYLYSTTTESWNLEVKNITIIDLTLFFNGNIPENLTPSKFEQKYNINGFYGYNAGQLNNNDAKQFESVGFNLWDEEWESGRIFVSTGANDNTNNGLRSKNYIPVFPSTNYYYKKGSTGNLMYVVYYEANQSVLSYQQCENQVKTTPANCAYIRFYIPLSAGAVVSYPHDICINLSDPAKNGTYEPYRRIVTDLNLDAIQVKSHNLWDEEWEAGTISQSTGNNTADATRLRSKNYISVTPKQTLYFYGASRYAYYWIFYYDKNKNFIVGSNNGSVNYKNNVDVNNAAVVPDNAYYLRFYEAVAITNVQYNNDICVNESSSFNGQYEPHGILTINGLKSAGSVYDEITNNGRTLIRRVGDVDLGDLTWAKNNYGFQSLNFPAGYNRVICSKYKSYGNTADTSGIQNQDKVVVFNYGTSNTSGYFASKALVVRDTAYSSYTYDQFETEMSGVKLYYELTTPIEYELASPIPTAMFSGTTERLLPEDTEDSVIAPFCADMTYGTNNGDVLADMAGLKSTSDATVASVTTLQGYFTNGILNQANMSATNINGALGNTAVNRATADADGNTISSTYLKLSGGTLESVSSPTLNINVTNGSSNYIAYKLAGTKKAELGYWNSSAYIENSTTGYNLRLHDNGDFTYRGYDILHSGNYGSYALPLYGGTLYNTQSSSPLTIKGSATYSGIYFTNNADTGMGTLYADTSHKLLWHDTTNVHDVYHSGNANLTWVDWNCSRLVAVNDIYTRYVEFYDTSLSAAVAFIGRGSSASNDIQLWTYGSDPIRFCTNSTERMTISSGGYVGIGTTTPSYTLHVAGTFYASGTATHDSYLDMKNGCDIRCYNAGNSAVRSALVLNGSNDFYVGYGMNEYNTYLCGSAIYLLTGTSRGTAMTLTTSGTSIAGTLGVSGAASFSSTITASGNITSSANVVAAGGVAAGGIADLSMN